VVLLLMACSNPCPAGLDADEDRTATLATLAGGETDTVCYGEAEMGRRPDGVIVLDPSWPDDALAARWAHLRLHTPLEKGPDCLDRAIEEEAHARMAELRLREQLGVTEPVLAWGEVADEAALSAWLRVNPDKAVSGYRLRCEN
jgi:hypothetical protein